MGSTPTSATRDPTVRKILPAARRLVVTSRRAIVRVHPGSLAQLVCRCFGRMPPAIEHGCLGGSRAQCGSRSKHGGRLGSIPRRTFANQQHGLLVQWYDAWLATRQSRFAGTDRRLVAVEAMIGHYARFQVKNHSLHRDKLGGGGIPRDLVIVQNHSHHRREVGGGGRGECRFF